MANHKRFLRALRKVLTENFKTKNLNQIQVTDGIRYIYISKKKPRKTIMRPSGTSTVEWDVTANQDPDTGLWIWTY